MGDNAALRYFQIGTRSGKGSDEDVSQSVCHARSGDRDGDVSNTLCLSISGGYHHRGVILRGLIGDSGKGIVMPDSVKWQSGGFRYFREVVKGNRFRLFFVVCRDISAFKDRSPFPAARIFMNSGEKPTPINCYFQCFYLWRVA